MLIITYSRANAIADGFLVDVTETAKECGFKVPVALTSACWENCVQWEESDNKRQTYQDEAGRLWDIVWMLFLAIKKCDSDTLYFKLYRIPRGGKSRKPRLIKLKAVMSAGDSHEPVLTIMLPDED